MDGQPPAVHVCHPFREFFVRLTQKGRTFRQLLRLNRIQCLIQIRDDVLDVLETDRQTHQARLNARRNKLFIGQLAMGLGSRMQHAGTDVRHMHEQGGHLEAVD